jgi:DNA-binding Lrp family transcriptional regulator
MTGVKYVYAVTGAHDLIILCETESIETLGDLILSKIRSIDGVMKTMTSIVLNI